MLVQRWIRIFLALALPPLALHADDMTGRVKKAVERCTLDQPGTKPFHLKAMLAPSFDRDKDSGRTGEVEIWWKSPTQWRREVRSPEFHQIEILDGEFLDRWYLLLSKEASLRHWLYR